MTHVHGMEAVEDWSDGYAEAWFLPAATDIPAGLRHRGHLVRLLHGQGRRRSATTWGPGRATFRYPNSQRPSTAWYHDHTLGMTRLNVYAGPAGFCLIRSDDPADNPTVAGTGAPAVLPGPAPSWATSRARGTTRSRSRSRTVRSTPTARCSTQTLERSSTGSTDRTSLTATSRRSGTRSSSATASS